MTREDTIIILGILKTAYPQFYKDMRKDEAESAIALWSEMFADDDVNLVKAAVKALIATDTKGFPPVIGQVRQKMYELTHYEAEMTEEEAWQKVKSAIGYYDASERFEQLPPILQRLVGGASQLRDWALMDAEHVETVVKSNFQRSFRARYKSEKEYMCLPSDVKKIAVALSEKLSMPQLE